MKFIFLLSFIIFLMGHFIVPKSQAGTPLDLNDETYIKKTNFGYTPPSASIISFENSEFIKAHPGFFWYKNWYFTTMDVELMGNDIFSRKSDETEEDTKAYVHTMYIKIIRAGYLHKIPSKNLILVGDLHAGFFYTNDIREITVTETNIENKTKGGAGISLGLRWNPGNFYFDILSAFTGSDKDSLVEVYLDFGYNINPKWKIGLYSEGGTRSLKICEDDKDPACTYKLNLNYTAFYAAYRFYKKWWLAFGLGASSMELGTNETSKTARTGLALYLSIR